MTNVFPTEAPATTDLLAMARRSCVSALWDWIHQPELDLHDYDLNGVAVFVFDLGRLEAGACKAQWEFYKSSDGLEVWDTSLSSHELDDTPRVELALSIPNVLLSWVVPARE